MATFNSTNGVNNNSLPVRTANNGRTPVTFGKSGYFSNTSVPTPHHTKHQHVQLPSGTFRSDYYDKTILLSDGTKTRKFHFSIEYDYWDDPNFGDPGYETYRIYILSFPCKPDFDCSASHEAHMFYDDERCDYFICWDEPITSFEDANAIAFVWAKKFLCNCMSNSVSHKRIYLPSGTFRSSKGKKKKSSANGTKRKSSTYNQSSIEKICYDDDDYFESFEEEPEAGSDVIYMTPAVYGQIKKTIGSHKAEQGGMLGSSDGIIVDTFIYDKSAATDGAAYSPDVDYLNDVLEQWDEEGISFAGFVHSHPIFCTSPSYADEAYCKRIMREFDMEKVFMPIVITEPDSGKFSLKPYIVGLYGKSETYCEKCELEIAETSEVDIEEEDYMQGSSMDEKQIAEKFAKQEAKAFSKPKAAACSTEEKLGDSAFDRVSNAVDLDLLSRSLVIGIGCGGAREFYIDMARIGVKNFLLMDGDTVSTSNLSSQNVYSSEIGKNKTDVIASRIHEIDSSIKVISVPEYLTDKFNDGWFESMITCFDGIEDVLLCAFTDSFNAQARSIRLAMKYGFKYISAQHYSKGLVSEIIYWHPEKSVTSPRTYLADRYNDYLEKGFKNDVTSKGSPIFNTVRLNGLCEKIACGLLMDESEKNQLYSDFLEKCPEKNLILVRQHSINGVFPGLEDLFRRFSGNNLFDDCIWLSADDIGIEDCWNKDEADYLDDEDNNTDTRILK